MKRETSLCGFAKVGLRGGENFFGMSQKFASTLVDQIGIQIYDQIQILRNCSKGKFRRAVSTGLGLKGVKMS